MKADGVPAWVFETPAEHAYTLDMSNTYQSEENIELSRDEYIALKSKLAEMRGYCRADARGESGAIDRRAHLTPE